VDALLADFDTGEAFSLNKESPGVLKCDSIVGDLVDNRYPTHPEDRIEIYTGKRSVSFSTEKFVTLLETGLVAVLAEDGKSLQFVKLRDMLDLKDGPLR
jgi:hypothetical protein